jgi:predicted dienelactone hydrolase
VARFPLVVFSHHYEGVRFSLFSVAEHLASLGYVVAAPDHVGGTIYEHVDGMLATPLNSQFLQVRVSDIESVIDILLDGTATVVPQGLRDHVDPERVGVFGHSFGGVTAGVVAVHDSRIKAAAYIAVPPTLPLATLLLGTPEIQLFPQPALFLLAQQDKAVGQLGIDAIRTDFQDYVPPAWLVEVRDAGHWSFADDCALVKDFSNGCGTGTRLGDSSSPFTFVDNETARGIAKRYIGAFFQNGLAGGSPAPLSEAVPAASVIVSSHSSR